ncbi:putative ribonuclease H-like domain-containing protein [Tanacetum coccineum]
MVPRAVLMKTSLRSLNTARPVNTAHPKTTIYNARPMSHFSKLAQSTVKRPYQTKTALTNKNSSQKANTTKEKFYTARPKAVNTPKTNSAVVNVVRENQVNAVTASACWVWRPTKLNSASITLKKHNYVDAREDQGYVDSGCSRHMTGNMSYLSNFKEFDGGYVTFRRGAKGGKITGKGTLKMGKLDFKDVVLFTDTACFVLSPDFKLPKESKVLLKVPRKKNMYSIDMKNIVPKESLTCLVAKATLDESMLWHRRIGHVNFKTINKLVKDNLVKGLPLKRFKNDQTCVVCLKGKRHKTSYLLRKVEESLHIRFLEAKPIISGDGPKWLFDIDVLTKSMNYVPVVAGINSNDFKDGLLFDSSSKNANNDEPQPSSDAGKKDDGVRKESGIENQEMLENSTQDVNTIRPSINTASINITTGSLNNNTISPTVTTARSNGTQTEPDMFSLGDNATLEATHADFFGDETEVDMSNITTTYPVLSTLNTRIHKDYALDHVIRDVQSVEPKKVIQALIDPSWIEAMQNELLHQEEGINYDEVFASVARIEAIRLFLAYASFKDFVVYQMDVKSAFLYVKMKEEVYVCQPLGFENPKFPNRVYKVEKALYSLHQAPRAWYETLSTYLLDNGFQRGLQVSQKDDEIFISQDKYVDEILKKFGFSTVKTASTPIDTSKPLLKDAEVEAEDVDVYLYRSMIGSLMYLTVSRPDIMFAVCACARFQVTPKVSHLHVVRRIFRYLKGQPKLGLWYPKDLPFNLEAYTDSEYAGASLDKKSTTGEYVAAASCCGQVIWIQNQMPDYGYNFKNTKIYIDNESTICIVKNPVFHSKTKHIKIRNHFIRDSNKKKLIQMSKIHTDHNVADLLTKAFDVGRFQYLIANIGMLNL